MLTIAFLICLQSGECFSYTPPITFETREECEYAANTLIQSNKEDAARGDAPHHVAYYQCVEWGEPA